MKIYIVHKGDIYNYHDILAVYKDYDKARQVVLSLVEERNKSLLLRLNEQGYKGDFDQEWKETETDHWNNGYDMFEIEEETVID